MNNETLTLVEFNGSTGETIIRSLTSTELTERQTIQVAQEALQVQQDAKIAARQSALAKLATIGLTQEEIEAL